MGNGAAGGCKGVSMGRKASKEVVDAATELPACYYNADFDLKQSFLSFLRHLTPEDQIAMWRGVYVKACLGDTKALALICNLSGDFGDQLKDKEVTNHTQVLVYVPPIEDGQDPQRVGDHAAALANAGAAGMTPVRVPESKQLDYFDGFDILSRAAEEENKGKLPGAIKYSRRKRKLPLPKLGKILDKPPVRRAGIVRD